MKAFKNVDEPQTPEESLWRERAARMTLDALGYTNLTNKPYQHNNAVRYSRRWFRGLYDGIHIPKYNRDSAEGTFDSAGVDFTTVRNPVLRSYPLYL